jgi:hypothetical protein
MEERYTLAFSMGTDDWIGANFKDGTYKNNRACCSSRQKRPENRGANKLSATPIRSLTKTRAP